LGTDEDDDDSDDTVDNDEVEVDTVDNDDIVVDDDDDSNGSDRVDVVEASFEEAFASELEAVHGELGNAAPAHRGGGGGRRRGR
nr:hypothetical protein [Acidimicrobiales bacterium]